MKALIITYVWPEPRSSAAGLRSWNLIQMLLKAGFEVSCASHSNKNDFSMNLDQFGIKTYSIQMNDSRFDTLVSEIQPDFVIFDRFVVEEQFGWRVSQACPNAVRILDTQDLHFLRRARQRGESPLIPNADSFREIASIYRSDCTLVLSDYELNLLISSFRVPKELLYLSRFHYSPRKPIKSFEDRSGFCFIGNFRHAPNLDAVRWLKKEIFPELRRHIPDATVSIYGAYPSKEAMDFHKPQEGFHVLGSVEDQFEAIQKHRVNLAPLRFGAGIKGKITDGWWTGTPVISTTVGAEGMHEGFPFGGEIADSASDFAEKAVQLYFNREKWIQSQKNGFDILDELYSESHQASKLLKQMHLIHENLKSIRQGNFIGSMLAHHSYRSTEYFSKWIEVKNQLPKKPLQSSLPETMSPTRSS